MKNFCDETTTKFNTFEKRICGLNICQNKLPKKKLQSYERVNKHSKDLRALKINNRKTNLGNCLRRQNQFSNTSKA